MTTRAGRPLRFILVVIGGWIALRTVQLWPVVHDLPPAFGPLAPAILAAPAPPPTTHVQEVASGDPPPIRFARLATPPIAWSLPPAAEAIPMPVARRRLPDTGRVALALASLVYYGPAQPVAEPISVPPRPTRIAVPRLGGSSWAIARGGGGAATPFAPQLGGSQAGARLTYALGDARRLSLAARFSSALSSRQREAAAGLDWQPTALPIHLVAEQRFGIENARGGPAIGLIGGLPPVPIAAGFALDGYAQAGAIARRDVEGYADAAIRLARPIAAAGPVRLDLGLGAWGGAQRGAARLDVGTSASLALPTPGRTVRLSVEWRQRIAGTARPGSGPALSIGTDF